MFLNDITVDPETGTLFVSDSGDRKGKGGAVFRITPKIKMKKGEKKLPLDGEVIEKKVDVVVDFKTHPELNTPNGLAMDGQSFLLLADFGSGNLYRIKLADKTMEKLADGFDGADGVAWDYFGRLYISSWKTGKIFVIPRPGDRPILMTEGFESAADICLDPTGKFMLVPDMKAGTLTKVPCRVPGVDVNDTPLKLETAVAFPDLKWTGWKGETDAGKVFPLRPVVLTHAGDGSNRVFVGIQQGIDPRLPQRSEGGQDQGLPRHSRTGLLQRQRKRTGASWAWRSIRTSRRTASSSSSTPARFQRPRPSRATPSR